MLFLFPSLNIVVILPIFKHFGNFPSVKLLLIMVFRGSAMQLLISLVSLQEILSYPDESFDGRLSTAGARAVSLYTHCS